MGQLRSSASRSLQTVLKNAGFYREVANMVRQAFGIGEEMTAFEWHSGNVTRTTPITSTYANTQKVRRFLVEECGSSFKFDREFMGWMMSAVGKTVGDAIDERKSRNA